MAKMRVPHWVTPAPKALSRAWARFSPAVSLSPTPSSTYARPALMPVVLATDQPSYSTRMFSRSIAAMNRQTALRAPALRV